MDRQGTTALFRGDRDLAHLLPAADDLGGRGRSRLCRARTHRRLRADRDRHRRRRKTPAPARSRQLIALSLLLATASGVVDNLLGIKKPITSLRVLRIGDRPPRIY